MKRIFVLGILLSILFAFPQETAAQPFYAECDACGYCKGQEPPDNWASCARCLYPTIVTDPNATKDAAKLNRTLEIQATQPDPQNLNNILTNRAIQPEKGRYYTQLGCLNTGLLSFRNDPGAAGATVNFILNNLLFPIAGTLAFGTIIYAAFLLLTAQGDQMKVEQGKRMLTGSIVGLVFTFGTVFIINVIAADILKIPGFARGSEYALGIAGQCPQEPLDPIYGTIDPVCPKIALIITDKTTNNEVARVDIAEVKGSVRSIPTTMNTISSSFPAKFDPNTQYFTVSILNDYYQAPTVTSEANDRNLWVQSFIVDSYRCTAIQYQNIYGGVYVFNLNGTSPVSLNWKGTATCTSWAATP